MRVVIQRVTRAAVSVDGRAVSSIGAGLMCLLGVEVADTEEDVQWLASKIVALRIFDDADGVMNLNVTQAGGAVMVVSQFTLHASTRKGNRPSYIRAARPEVAEPLYERMCEVLEQKLAAPVARGIFGADMAIDMINSGPVTIIIDSRLRE